APVIGPDHAVQYIVHRIEAADPVVPAQVPEPQHEGNMLLQKEPFFRRLFESEVVGIAISDTDRILEANDYFLRTLQYSRKEFEKNGASWKAIEPAEYAEADQRQLQEMLETGINPASEKELLRSDGTRAPVLVSRVTVHKTPEVR